MLPLGDVIEQNGDSIKSRRADSKGIHIIPAVQRFGLVLEADGLTAQSDRAVHLKPMLFKVRGKCSHRLTHSIGKSRLLFKGHIHLKKTVVQWSLRLVEEHFNYAEALVEQVQHGS